MTTVYLVLALVGLVAGLNLIFTIGLIRRIRVHTRDLARLDTQTAVEVALPAGAAFGGFSAVATNGHQIDSGDLGPTVIGVFSPHCSACEAALPEFASRASKPGTVPFVAVVAARGEDAAHLVGQLPLTTSVVVEPDGGPVQQALGVTGYPAFLLLENGFVQASSYDLAVVLDQTTFVS